MPTKSSPVVREAAVAGLFYPGNAPELGNAIDYYLAHAHPEAVGDLKAIICPHAGPGRTGRVRRACGGGGRASSGW